MSAASDFLDEAEKVLTRMIEIEDMPGVEDVSQEVRLKFLVAKRRYDEAIQLGKVDEITRE